MGGTMEKKGRGPSERALARLAARQSAVQRVLGTVGGGLFLGGASFGLLGAFTTDWLFIPAGTLAIGSGVLFLIRSAMGAAD
ncbi:MAG: hypothetical protein EOO72_11650, partial [Myxococcaceae bacterium]